MRNTYDTIGVNYSNLRMPDLRIAEMIRTALGESLSVLNVGAGAGSYEPTDMDVTALEPSAKMISQRAPSAATVIQGHAEDLPFDDDSFDASMAVLTIHHWTDKQKGLAEMRRVTRGHVVLLTYDPDFRGFWLTDYFPELITLDEGKMPKISELESWLGPIDILPVPVPNDCTDGFVCAHWRRPAAYLDPKIRAAMSPFWKMTDISDALNRLESDLETGAWEAEYGDFLELDSFDAGYRLIRTR